VKRKSVFQIIDSHGSKIHHPPNIQANQPEVEAFLHLPLMQKTKSATACLLAAEQYTISDKV
jgi:hypothetical protein